MSWSSPAAPPSAWWCCRCRCWSRCAGSGLTWRPGYAFPADARARVGGLAVAGAVTVTAQQLALVVILNRVSGGPTGSPQVYNLAQTMYLLPWAVLAVPLAVAAYPGLVAAAATGDSAGYRTTVAATTRGCCCSASSARRPWSAPPNRSAGSSPRSARSPPAAAIAGFAPGLVGYGLFAVLSRALYARGATGRPPPPSPPAGWWCRWSPLPLAALLPRADRVLAVTLANSAGMLVLGRLLVGAARPAAAGRAALPGRRRSGRPRGSAGALLAAPGRRPHRPAARRRRHPDDSGGTRAGHAVRGRGRRAVPRRRLAGGPAGRAGRCSPAVRRRLGGAATGG